MHFLKAKESVVFSVYGKETLVVMAARAMSRGGRLVNHTHHTVLVFLTPSSATTNIHSYKHKPLLSLSPSLSHTHTEL